MAGVKDWMFKARGKGDGPFGGPGPNRSGGGGGGNNANGSCMSDSDCGGNKVCRNGTCKAPASGSGEDDTTTVDGSAANYQNYQQNMDALVSGIANAGDMNTSGPFGDFLTRRISPTMQAAYEQWKNANPSLKKNGILDWLQSQNPMGEESPDWITANANEQRRKKKEQQQKNGVLAAGNAPQQWVDQFYREGIGNYMDLAGYGQGSTRWSGF